MTVADVRTEAERQLEARPQNRYGIWTDMTLNPERVAIGIAIRGLGSCVIAVERAEYDGRKLQALVEEFGQGERT